MDTWVYDVATDSWEELAPLPYQIHHPLHFGVAGSPYILGGHSGSPVYDKVWRLTDDTDDAWTEVASIPGPGRVAATQFDHAGKGYILGGEMAIKGNNLLDGWVNGDLFNMSTDPALKEDHRSMPTNELLEYDPVENTWTSLPPTPDDGSRWASSNFILDGGLYNFAGVKRKGHYHCGNFTQRWPTQGYRMYLGEGEEQLETTDGDEVEEEVEEEPENEDEEEDSPPQEPAAGDEDGDDDDDSGGMATAITGFCALLSLGAAMILL
ncbi:MAG: hypothetical protein SGARI_005138 [Bacillariaceae sp.]